jgi:cell division septum initiation protein DivIVA
MGLEGQTREAVQHEAAQAAEHAKSATAEVAETAREQARQVTREAGEQARHVVDDARRRLSGELGRRPGARRAACASGRTSSTAWPSRAPTARRCVPR